MFCMDKSWFAGGDAPDDDGDFVPLDEVEKLQSEAMEGLRESFTKQITGIEDEIVDLKSNIKQQGDVSFKLLCMMPHFLIWNCKAQGLTRLILRPQHQPTPPSTTFNQV